MAESPPIREMEFPSVPESINLIESLVEELKMEFSLTEEAEANILVSLSEVVNNAIFHGNQSDPLKKVRIKMELLSNEFKFSVEDEGIGFDVNKVKDPTAPENLDKPTGRGIFLMRNLADRVEFIEGGRKVVLTFLQG